MTRRSLPVLVACLALVCTSVFASSSLAGSGGSGSAEQGSAQVSAAASCKTVRYSGRSYILYRQGKVRCLFAKRWVRRLHRSKGRNKPPGWKCSSGSKYRTGGGCTRGSRAFGWHPGD
jgi:hypothetical protein